MNDVLYMAWRYVRFHRGKTRVLVAAMSLVLFLPAGLHVVRVQTEDEFGQRRSAHLTFELESKAAPTPDPGSTGATAQH